ncbi:4F2 cell-surface antigen heavy chain isoform X3 [Oreochromis aureus]|uniref:Solute carrier family 3 member 2 N-terminal domain-containing protein n=1 Tax=Oreochromis aureus TaxID=47969 RepID=A0AAZ1X4I4_OREAU|nr:4F2 cell-surface antigen heavy chain isoform X3 [Oreochromis aureus]
MPVNAGHVGYGSVPSGASETCPLLTPEPDSLWRPMTREELEAANGPGWRKVRCYLVLLFWLAWVTILATSVAIIIKSPRPVATPLKWWQKSLFYQLQADKWTEAQTEGPEGMCAMDEQLPYLKSLGIGALILKGVFDVEVFPLNLTAADKNFAPLAWMQHLLSESHKADLKIVLDLCKLDLLAPQGITGNLSATTQRALHFWLENGVAGFVICDTDAAYSEKTLLEWRRVFGEFSSPEEERIVVEVADAVERCLQTRGDDIWPSWTVGGNPSQELKKLLLVLMMTLPGSPAIHYDKDMEKTKDKSKMNRAALQLFSSLSFSKAREEALQYGSFTFLPFNTSSSSNSSLSSPLSPPILAFLRSWGCVHFLVLLNFGFQPQSLDPAWASSLPEAGLFVASTGMDRFVSTSLYSLRLRPYEAIVIKLLEAQNYS